MSAVLGPSQRSMRARIAAYTRASQYDGTTVTADARAAFLRRFLEQVDAASPGLNPEERERRALALRKAYMTRLAFASSKARARQPKTMNAQPLLPGKAFVEGADDTAPSTE